MITSKTLPESDGLEAFESILRIGHGLVRNGVQQEFLSMSSKGVCLMKGTKKLGEYKD